MDRETPIYIVYGPTAEWGDGSGPLFYSDSLKDCGSYVRGERRFTIDYAAQGSDDFANAESKGLTRDYADACTIAGWPYNQTPYWLGCETLGYFGIPEDVDMSDPDDVMEYLNQSF